MAEPAKRALGSWVEMVLHTSVATLYDNLVTRPTGRAVRHAIESQLGEFRGTCLSVLDFSEVRVLDFSCADEIIAQLLRRFRGPDRPSEAYFVIQGASEHHRDPIEAVLSCHHLLLVSLGSGPELWGPAPQRLRRAWSWLEQTGSTRVDEFAAMRNLTRATASSWLKKLADWRVAIPDQRSGFSSLIAPLQARRWYLSQTRISVGERAVAETCPAYGNGEPQPAGAGSVPAADRPLRPEGGDLGGLAARSEPEANRDQRLG